MARHTPVLQQLLPPESYDPKGIVQFDELEATALALDDLQDLATWLLLVYTPYDFPELLPMLEEMFGLPDEYSTDPSFPARMAAVIAKRNGRQATTSIPFLTQYAEAFGYTNVSIIRHRPATCIDSCNSPLWGERHRFMLDVHVTGSNDGRLELAFHRLQQAEVMFRFFYD